MRNIPLLVMMFEGITTGDLDFDYETGAPPARFISLLVFHLIILLPHCDYLLMPLPFPLALILLLVHL
jgi:hypothetical protein